MSTIFAYGDSYVSERFESCPGWTRLLASDMNMNLRNFGVDGSSTHVAINNFHNTMTEIQDGDIVIFSFSSPGRIHFQHQNEFPGTATLYAPWYTQSKSPTYADAWYYDSKPHIKWYMENYDVYLETIIFEGYRHLLKSFAESRPLVTVVVSRLGKSNIKTPIPVTQKNFLEIPVILKDISNNEFIESNLKYKVNHNHGDVRVNHLSNKNLKILSDLVKQAVLTLDVGHITYDKFEKNIFQIPHTVAEYQAYLLDYEKHVESGYLYDNSFYRDILENNYKNGIANAPS